jgi:hypothetical protein
MKIRVDNIECRCKDGRYDIICYYRNIYYGAEEQMISEGWERVEKDGEFYGLRKDHSTITAGCFVNPEHAYSIASLEYDANECCCELTTVGPRVLDLKKKDRKAFFKVYKLAEKAIREENRRRDD